MTDPITDIVLALRGLIYYGILLVSVFAGCWYGYAAIYNGYRTATGEGDKTSSQILLDLFFASICLSISGYLAAQIGDPFSSGMSGNYPQFSGDLGEATQSVNSTMAAAFALCSALGWIALVRAVFVAREVGQGRTDATPWQAARYWLLGSALADLGTLAKDLDALLHTGFFS